MTDLFSEVPPTDDTSKREELLNKWKDKSPEEVLKAKIDADLFIETLTKRQDDLNKDYLEMKKNVDAQASLQELVDRLNQKATSNSETPPAKEGTEPQKEVDITEKVKALIAENKRIERQTDNANFVQTKLKERFGNSYQDVLRDTGLSQKQINEIAADSPEAIFRLVGLDSQSKETFQTPPQSATRPSFAPKTIKRNWAFYQEMKKGNPTLYLDSKIAVQMHNDAIEQGESFYA